MKPNEREKYLYTDDVDYADTQDNSIWGAEDKATINLLNKIDIAGRWLNLCAGDGRFNNHLLKKPMKLLLLIYMKALYKN